MSMYPSQPQTFGGGLQGSPAYQFGQQLLMSQRAQFTGFLNYLRTSTLLPSQEAPIPPIPNQAQQAPMPAPAMQPMPQPHPSLPTKATRGPVEPAAQQQPGQ